MKKRTGEIAMGVALLLMSVLFYALHYLLFRDAHHIFIYLCGDVAFVFVEVLLVSLIIHRVLERRDRNARREKLNMVIGSFFSEIGTPFLQLSSRADPALDALDPGHEVGTDARGRYMAFARFLGTHNYGVDAAKVAWDEMRDVLVSKRDFMLRLLENPNLLEHEVFTDVLLAVFHLTEELSCRPTLAALPETDAKHLAGDVNRAYARVARQWLDYMRYLGSSYPYLFSLSLRTNPFDRRAVATVTEPSSETRDAFV